MLYWKYDVQEAVRRGRYKLLRGNGHEALFDLALDPGEQRNLLPEQPRRAAELRRSLAAWAAELAPRVQ
jgi:hypothetical protein